MRALALAVVALALAGCPSTGGCPVDTISSASQCIPIQDLAVPDLSRPVATSCPASYEDILHNPTACASGLLCAFPAEDAGLSHACYCGDDHLWHCD
jgi:hypothetical protein